MYTGALENSPNIVAQIDRPLWGNSPEILRRVRSPMQLKQALEQHGVVCPAVCLDVHHVDPKRRYVLKPIRTAGGAHLRMFESGTQFDPRRCYLQEWIEGEPCSAVYVGNVIGRAQLLGATRQLIGESWLGAAPFQWCGNIGPISLGGHTSEILGRIGDALAQEFALRGLFGVDFILRDGTPWPVEVNPRYPASLEVLERAIGKPLLALHAAAFGVRGESVVTRPVFSKVVAKAVLFTQRTFVVTDAALWQAAMKMPLEDLSVPFADIPPPGTRVDAGHPICTVFADAVSIQDCLIKIRSAVAELQRRLAN